MTKPILIKLFISAATRPSAEAQLERVLKELPEEYAHYVYDVDVARDKEVAALDNVTTTPCLIVDNLHSGARRSLVGVFEDEQVRRLLLGLDQSE